MKIQFKRIVSAVCALALCASMMPASALAEPVVSGGDTAIVQQVEEDTSVPVTETTDETTEPVDVADTAETETDTAQPAEDASESEAAEPETSTQPEETEQNSADAEQPATSDVSEPEAAAAVEEQAPVALADGVETYAGGWYDIKKTYNITVGEEITIEGNSGLFDDGSWSIEAGDSSTISFVYGTDGRNVTVQGKKAGTVILRHRYYRYVNYVNEYYQVNVDASGEVFLFVAKPGNTTLSSNGSDYYFLTYGGQTSDKASADMPVIIDQTNEEEITKYVSSWPIELKTSITNTSSEPVDSGSTWTIDEKTGKVTDFTLILNGVTYSSDSSKNFYHEAYGIRWAKFSWASTGEYGNQYHADAILYKKVTVEDAINELQAQKMLTDFSLDSEGNEKTSETFTFKLESVDENDSPVEGGVDITLTAEVSQLNSGVLLVVEENNKDTELVPGRYKLSEVGLDSNVWETPSNVVFEIYTNGKVHPVSENTTITNIPKTYTLTYNLKGGDNDEAFDQVTGLKYNKKTTIASEIPTKRGSVFLGWSTNPDATEADENYAPDNTIQITDSVTLYAVWGKASATKTPVTADPQVPSIDINDYADVNYVTSQQKYTTYTADAGTILLYQITVKGYDGAKLTIEDNPSTAVEGVQVGSATYVAATGAKTEDNGQSFTMTAPTATLYYSVAVTDLDKTKETNILVNNSAKWTISSGRDEQTGTTAVGVTIIKTENKLTLTKTITSVLRNRQELDDEGEGYTDETILRAGDVVTYQITVTNSGKAVNHAATVQDALNGAGTLPASITVQTGSGAKVTLPNTVTEADENGYYWVHDWHDGAAQWCVGELDVGEMATITYTYTVNPDDASVKDEDSEKYSKLTNTVSTIEASGSPSPSTSNFVEKAEIGVTKEGTVADNGKKEAGGMLIKYKVMVTNNGNTNLKTIVLTDDMFPAGDDASEVIVKAGNQTVSSSGVSLDNGELTVDLTNNALQPGQAMTVEYVYAVKDSDKDPVHNDVAVTATTVKDLTAKGDGSADVNVYEGTITVAPASIVIYTGGTGGQSVVDDDGSIVSSEGIPTLGFTFSQNGELMTFSAEDTLTLIDISGGDRAGYSWTGTLYNKNAKTLLQLDPTAGAENEDPVRIQLTDPDDPNKVFTNDEFEIGEDLYKVYKTAIFTNIADGQEANVVAEINGKYYKVELGEAELSIRGTTSSAVSTFVANSEESLKDNVHVPQAVVPENAKFYYVGTNGITNNGDNSGSLAVEDTSSVSLLVDEIVDQTVETDQEYVQKMKEKVEADSNILGAVPADTARLWRFYYMDLVLANNGNAVLTTDQNVDIYWPYPDGVTYQDVVDGKYNFTVLHYTGLNRNYESGNFEQELKDCSVEKYTVTPTENGLKFTVPSADGFSPYALVYQYSTKGPDQTVTVEGDDHPDIAEAIANGTWGQPTPTPAPAVIPQTSDDMPLGMLIGAAAVAAAALVVLTVLRRRRRKQ